MSSTPYRGLPTLDHLEQYDTILVINEEPFADPVGLGDLLADFVDQGGGVIETFATAFFGGVIRRWVGGRTKGIPPSIAVRPTGLTSPVIWVLSTQRIPS